MNLAEIVIESDRLLQIAITQDYAADIFLHFTKEVTTFMYPQPAEQFQETTAFIARSIVGLQAGTNLQLVILHRETKEFLGCSGLHNLDCGHPELGIWLKPAAHGHAYGLEAIGALIAWAQERLDYEYLKYPVDISNTASKRIPEFYGGVAADRHPLTNLAGKTLDIVEYRIDRRPSPIPR